TGRRPTTREQLVSSAPGGEPPRGFERVLDRLGGAFDVDFEDYKLGTLQRRTMRRMSLRGIGDWDEYAELLGQDPYELNALYHDVLIGVTEFFRDPPVWEQLGKEIAVLAEQRSDPGLRAWVPACGTGEEAYSLVMTVCEALPADGHSRIQVYATDLNERALEKARRGIYPPEHMVNVSPERREQFFRHGHGQLQVDPRVRECVTFAPHNTLSDPPFSNMDVVSCRNLLIYLKPHAHGRILRRFHFALSPHGLLVIGRAEALGRQSGLFEEISKIQGIYRACESRRTHTYQITARPAERLRPTNTPAVPPAVPPARELRPDRRIEQFVLSQRTPACVAVNADLEILHFYGQTQHYLVPPIGEARNDLLAWIRPGFYIRLRSAARRAIDSNETVTTEGQIERDGAIHRVQCSIEPLARAIAADGIYLVMFRDLGGPEVNESEQADDGEPLARALEQELVDTRRELLSAVEQLEAAGEEHRASHEELLSLNEELQSSNEELEASKEELEALNEEMNTINRELEDKNVDLRAANADLNNLFLNTGIPTIFLDSDMNIRRFTPAAASVMRLVPSDVGRSIAHVKERFDDGRTIEDVQAVLSTLEPRSKEVWTEESRCFLRRVQPYHKDEQAVDGVCITFTDVTEQRQAAIANEVARRYAESIIRHVRTPLLVLNEQLRVVTANPAFMAAFRIEASLENRRLSELEEGIWKTGNLIDALREIALDRQDIRDREVSIDDHIFLVNLSMISREQDEDLMLVSFEDVTRDRKARADAAERQKELARDASRKDQRIAMLGHELRNPIGAIANGIELVRQDALDEDRRGKIHQMLKRQIRQVNRLLDDLLDAGRVIAGKLQVAREPVDMAQVARWSVETVGPTIERRRHTLTKDLPAEGTVWVEGDANRLTEVISNLLNNATKYTEHGGRIRLSVKAEDDTVSVVVEDSGAGIPADFMPHIFDVFSQGPRGLDRSAKGLGLGLPLVRNIVELHGGKVSAESEGPGRGSRFEITLPRLRYRPEGAPKDDADVRARSRRVLIVDDEPDSAVTLAELLKMQGHEIKAVHDGASALSVAKSFEPDVVLLDLGMPGMDGYEVARKLRGNGFRALLVALTGYHRDEARERAAGINHHLTKPVDHRRLAELLAERAP
ncbi:MAG TPA: CheR family methyltransferase, partial [Woeseiaceae bacterium]|nr:CheR family methyltransferase [Woeseiaceae bacterium]